MGSKPTSGFRKTTRQLKNLVSDPKKKIPEYVKVRSASKGISAIMKQSMLNVSTQNNSLVFVTVLDPWDDANSSWAIIISHAHGKLACYISDVQVKYYSSNIS